MKQNIKPYNDVWANCFDNMVMTLLDYSGGSTDIMYKNDYDYEFTPFEIPEVKIDMVTYGEEIIELTDFADVTYSDMIYSEEEFLAKVKEYISDEDCFVGINVDLFDWYEESLCYHRYHWNHYSILVDYDEEDDSFIIFDEAKGVFERSTKPAKEIYKNILVKEPGCIMFIKIREHNKDFLFDLDTVAQRAQERIQNINSRIDTVFYKMTDKDYDAGTFMDLAVLYLQRISARHSANAHLMRMIYEVVQDEEFLGYEDSFKALDKRWEKIKITLIKVFMVAGKRADNLRKLNACIEDSFVTEETLWKRIIEKLASLDDIDSLNESFRAKITNREFSRESEIQG